VTERKQRIIQDFGWKESKTKLPKKNVIHRYKLNNAGYKSIISNE